jgi:NADH-quinone oxidoreductase subunit N
VIGSAAVDPSALAPIGFVAIAAAIALVVEVALARAGSLRGRRLTGAWIGSLVALGSMAALVLSVYVALAAFQTGGAVFAAANPMFQLDPLAALGTVLAAAAAWLVCALSVAHLPETRIHPGGFHALVLLATAGAMLAVGAIDLITLYVGFELLWLPLPVLAGLDRRRARSGEAALKLFLTGAFASALSLYGMALLYGAAGSTSYFVIRDALLTPSPMALLGLALLLAGFGTRLAVAPFHQWAPDATEGGPAVVTAFLSSVVPAAAVVALMRFAAGVADPLAPTLQQAFGALAVLAMLWGTAMALFQENVKRLLAWSAVAQMGYCLVGLAAGGPAGYAAAGFAVVALVFIQLGALGVVIALADEGRECERIDELTGLARHRPGLAAAMALFLLALAGMPGTAGFVARFNLMLAAVQSGRIGLPLVLVATSVVSFYTYLRIPVQMYMREPTRVSRHPGSAMGEVLAIGVCIATVVYLGVLPDSAPVPLRTWVAESVSRFFAR